MIQASLIGWLVKQYGDSRMVRFGYLGQGIGLALNPFAGLMAPAVAPLALLMVASTLYAIGSSIANPTINGLCSRLTPDDRQGELFGLLQGTRSIGFVIGPVVGGALFDANPPLPYLVAGAVCLGAALLVPRK